MHTRRIPVASILFYLAMFIYVAVVLGILLTVVLNSVSKGWYTGALPPFLTPEWYVYVAGEHDILNLLFVTFVVAISVVGVSILVAFPAAYALSRREFRGKAFLLSLFLLPMIVPPMTYGIPLAMMLYKAHLAARIIGVILSNLVPIVPFVILILMPFIEQVGVNLESAAKMLGARRLTVFRKILVPLTLPGILRRGSSRSSGRSPCSSSRTWWRGASRRPSWSPCTRMLTRPARGPRRLSTPWRSSISSPRWCALSWRCGS